MSLREFIENNLVEINTKFCQKARQYVGRNEDELLNFRIGASLLNPDIQVEAGMFEAAKAYLAKHIAFLYRDNLSVYDNNIKESLQDIIIYSLIMKYMAEQVQRYDAKSESEDNR